MRKKIFGILMCGILILGLTGCGGIKEKDLVGLKYVANYDEDGEFIWHWEFKEENVLYWYSTNCGFSGGKICNADSEIYKIDNKNILIITNGNSIEKWKISEDLSTITEIGSEFEMSRMVE